MEEIQDLMTTHTTTYLTWMAPLCILMVHHHVLMDLHLVWVLIQCLPPVTWVQVLEAHLGACFHQDHMGLTLDMVLEWVLQAQAHEWVLDLWDLEDHQEWDHQDLAWDLQDLGI